MIVEQAAAPVRAGVLAFWSILSLLPARLVSEVVCRGSDDGWGETVAAARVRQWQTRAAPVDR
jgi:hypothetical protein